jgi:hypothetical protein
MITPQDLRRPRGSTTEPRINLTSSSAAAPQFGAEQPQQYLLNRLVALDGSQAKFPVQIVVEPDRHLLHGLTPCRRSSR